MEKNCETYSLLFEIPLSVETHQISQLEITSVLWGGTPHRCEGISPSVNDISFSPFSIL